jgi:hypothetical protein
MTFKGPRLAGNKVCLFDGPPQNYLKTSYHHGAADVCNQMRYPPPHDCRDLNPFGPLISEIPISVYENIYDREYMSDPAEFFDSPSSALGNAWARGPVYPHQPSDTIFLLEFLALIYSPAPDKYAANAWLNTLSMLIYTTQFNPAWRSDPKVFFSIALTPPVLAGLPSWPRLAFREYSLPFDGVPFEMPVVKEAFYEEDVTYDFRVQPTGFSYGGYLALPPFLGSQTRGFYYHDEDAFHFRVVVRGPADEFKVCWPEEVFTAAKYAAVVDKLTGFVVGPPIKIN